MSIISLLIRANSPIKSLSDYTDRMCYLGVSYTHWYTHTVLSHRPLQDVEVVLARLQKRCVVMRHGLHWRAPHITLSLEETTLLPSFDAH